MSKIAAKALEAGLTGFEFASGIPGTLGGALMMNAGAYGGEMKQVLKSAKVLDQEGIVFPCPLSRWIWDIVPAFFRKMDILF